MKNPVPLNSSHLSHIEHDGMTNTMAIRFRNGEEYTYRKVPREVYLKVLAHPSPGTAFNQLVKGNFPYSKK